MDSNNKITSWHLIRRLFDGYILEHKWKLIIAILSMIIIAFTTAAYARVMEPLIDQVLVNRDSASILLIPLLFLFISIVKATATYIQSFILGVFGQRIIAEIQNNLFNKLVNSDLNFFEKNATGSLISKFLNDANLLREALTKSLTGISKDFLTLVFLIILLFITDWQLALIATIGFPLSFFPVKKIGKRMRKASIQNQEKTSDFSALLNEAFTNLIQIKLYTNEKKEVDKIKLSNELRLKAIFKVIKTRAVATPLIEILAGIFTALVILYAAGFEETSNRLSAGEFVTFITALGLSYQPLRSIANLNTSLQEGLAAAHRIFNILDLENKIVDTNNAKKLIITRGNITFQNISFSYEKFQTLKDIDFEAKLGKKLAIVGKSGAGKSTILNLIPRFNDPISGKILIDDQDIKLVTLKSLRNKISFVSQNANLFNMSIFDNILYGKIDASEEEVFDAAEKAYCKDFVEKLPKKFDTIVGESGIKLSGGQKQRIAIARAFLKNAPIILLDEATSSLDTESEKKIQLALDKLIEGKTTIIVAHRLSTIVDADEIITIQDGKIVEKGKHLELINKGGVYSKLYNESQEYKDK
ncbi:MAG: Lipid A export ATP-binding/permease protein MsbA [Alphaproteobacteria bacterium MarineAlpha2_Bin1]|nr:MAG: Lipid A export ATP-binding/permease protein MsbA [Alphaproteobacteria bacterium MarineAlpha2_Bin1]